MSPRTRSCRARVTAAVVAGAALVAWQAAAIGAGAVTAPQPVRSMSTPETSLAGDGPIVAQADPFTLDAPGLAPGQIEMTTVSTRPTLVTGGEARIQVRGLQPDDHLVVRVDGRTTGAFVAVPSRPGQAPGIREGLVTGLALGANRLVATAVDPRYGSRHVTLTVVDHPLDGPVISGPHQEPFVCETGPSHLGPAADANCDVPTQITWYAKNLLGQWVALSNPYGPPPPGTLSIQAGGRTVPFVVRLESVVINRSVTRIAVLDDPAARGAGRPFGASEWNHDLLYQFGESCGTGFHQGSNQATDVFGQLTNISGTDLAGPVLDLTGHLRDGWMVAESTLTTFGVSCNPLTSAETLMTVKEHIVDAYGDVYHTVGAGASGGAIQQYLAANNYPGLIDAGTPLFSFPDIVTTAMTVTDCGLLDRVFAADPNTWSLLKQDAVTGEHDPLICQDWQSLFLGDLDPTSCPSGIPASQVYNPSTNPQGVRCDLADDDVNGLGRDESGRALLPLDNTGVQYGLAALRAGTITPGEFIALNRQVGGFNHDGHVVAQRDQLTASEAALLYRSGEITGQGALPETPIIDQSIPAGDLVPSLDIHQQVWPYVMRARLAGAGDTVSQAVWSGVGLPSDAIDVANGWLDQVDSLQRVHRSEPRAALVAQARPFGAHDQCRLVATGVSGPCDQGVLAGANPRQAAGGPLAMDNIDCRLRPVRAADYPSSVTPAQLSEIRQVFASGVCDYAAPPVGWTPHSATWLSAGATRLLTPLTPVPYALVRSGVPAVGGPPAAVRPAAVRASVSPATPGGPAAAGGPAFVSPAPALPTLASSPPSGGPPSDPLRQALVQLLGPPSAVYDAFVATLRALSTVLDGLP